MVEIDTSLFPVISAIAGDSVFCSTNNLTNISYSVTTQPNATYNWTVVGGTIVTGNNTSAITVNWNAAATTHEVRLQACNSFGCGNTFVKAIAIAPAPVAAITTSTGVDSFCFGDSLTLTANSGTYSYLWNTGSSDQSLVVGMGGNYVVTVTDNQTGCTDNTQKNVFQTVIDTSLSLAGFTLSANPNNDAFQWFDCATGLPIVGETNATYTFSGSGLYAVILTKNGCQDTSNCHDVDVISTTVLPTGADRIQVYPNPNQGAFTIDFGDYSQQDASIELWNTLGQRVYYTQRTTNIQHINRQQLPSGVYWLRIDRQFARRVVIE